MILVQLGTRASYALTIVELVDYPTISLLVLVKITLLSVSFFVKYRPYICKWDNFKAVMRELVLLAVTYHQLCLTDFTDLKVKTNVGNSIMVIVQTSAIINVLIDIGL